MIRNIVKKGKGEKQEIVQIEAFPIVFVTDCLKNSEKFQICLFTANRFGLKVCNYSLCHYDTSFNNFWNPNKQLKYLDKWGKIFFFQGFFQVEPKYEYY